MRRLPAPRDQGIVFYSGDFVANTKSAEKAARQAQKHRVRNVALRSRMRTAVRGVTAAIAAKNKDAAQATSDTARVRANDQGADLKHRADNAAHNLREKITTTAHNVKENINAKLDDIKHDQQRKRDDV